MEKRIKMLRKSLGLTQTQFGDRIGLKGNTITSYETCVRVPGESVIISICREFNVSRKWLETGDGDMFASTNQQTLDRIAQRYTDSPSFRQLLDVYASLDRAEQDAVEHYIMLLAQAVALGQDPALVDPTVDELEAKAAALSQRAAGQDDAAADG